MEKPGWKQAISNGKVVPYIPHSCRTRVRVITNCGLLQFQPPLYLCMSKPVSGDTESSTPNSKITVGV